MHPNPHSATIITQFVARARQAKLSRVGSTTAEEKREEEEEEEFQGEEENKEEEDTSTVRRMKSSNTGSTSQVGLHEMKPATSDSLAPKSPEMGSISSTEQKETSPAFITPPDSTADSASTEESKPKDSARTSSSAPVPAPSDNPAEAKPVTSLVYSILFR